LCHQSIFSYIAAFLSDVLLFVSATAVEEAAVSNAAVVAVFVLVSCGDLWKKWC
jgi:hypothetical protein